MASACLEFATNLQSLSISDVIKDQYDHAILEAIATHPYQSIFISFLRFLHYFLIFLKKLDKIVPRSREHRCRRRHIRKHLLQYYRFGYFCVLRISIFCCWENSSFTLSQFGAQIWWDYKYPVFYFLILLILLLLVCLFIKTVPLCFLLVSPNSS